MEVRVGPAVITTHLDDEVLVSDPDASLSSGEQQGYFIADTRLVSGYRLKIGRVAPVLLNSSQIAAHSARFEFTNAALVDDEGSSLPEHSIHLRVDRCLGRGVHEDYDLTNYSGRSLDVLVEVSLESDFADLFDVKDTRLQRRGLIESVWDSPTSTLVNRFRHEGFARGIAIEARTESTSPTYANGGLLFPVKLAPGEAWHACLRWRPILDDKPLATLERCHDLLGRAEVTGLQVGALPPTATITTNDPVITATIRQAIDDLVGLRMRAHVTPGFLDTDKSSEAEATTEGEDEPWLPAAGVPWFVSLFGRDALVTSLQALLASHRFATGSLRSLARLQATTTDDDRDMQPGKIEHELRRGELARLHLVPHTPYYGSADATPLFVLVAAMSWRWHGDQGELERLRPHVDAALSWIDRDGDPDGDGLQEYKTRSARGYFNQGWKDAHDAILHADGSVPELPLATCELQGLVVAAKRAWSEVLERAFRDESGARRLRDEADRLQAQIEERFWWEEEGTYYLALDGNKRPVASVASNAGHLLTYGAVAPERAERVAQRLFAEDCWSGWGIRTLSSVHPSYNPFSYQLGSVWPHDNVLIAAGLRRYGLNGAALRIARALFDAAASLQNRRLPELFAGLDRDEGAFPVQYLGANVPQAWASGAVVHLVEILLGLEVDAPSATLRLHPALPPWLTEVVVDQVAIGEHRCSFTVRRRPDGTHDVDLPASGHPISVVLESA